MRRCKKNVPRSDFTGYGLFSSGLSAAGLFDKDLITVVASGGAINYSLVCATGSYSVAGQNALLKVSRSLVCSTGSYSVTGQALSFNVARRLSCSTGSYSVSGSNAAFAVTRRLTCAAGSYALTGIAATLTYTPGAGAINYSLVCSAGSYAVNGIAAVLTYADNGALLSPAYQSRRQLGKKRYPQQATIYSEQQAETKNQPSENNPQRLEPDKQISFADSLIGSYVATSPKQPAKSPVLVSLQPILEIDGVAIVMMPDQAQIDAELALAAQLDEEFAVAMLMMY